MPGPRDILDAANAVDVNAATTNANKEPAAPNKPDSMGYLIGYNINLNDSINKLGSKGLTGGAVNLAKNIIAGGADKPLHDYSSDLTNHSTMPSDGSTLFKYSLNKQDFQYEDPTFLIYELIFEESSSALFNYGDPFGSSKSGSALKFIYSYSNIAEIGKRKVIYDEFINILLKIFNTDTTHTNNMTSRNKNAKIYYINSIKGLSKFSNKIVKYPEDKVTIELNEDVSLLSSYLVELYNNLIYSYKNQRYLIPDNCLRFDLKIKITDVRSFKIPNPNYDPNIKGSQTFIYLTDPPAIIYKLHDCNFDFFNSVPFEELLSAAGDSKMSSNSSKVSFDIIYKQISKEFYTPLIKNSLKISNKITNVADSNILGMGWTDNKSNTVLLENSAKLKSQLSTKLSITSKTLGQELKQDLVNSVSYLANDLISTATQAIRGGLLENLIYNVRKTIYLEKIQPENVYSTDGYLTKFARSLGSDLLNTLEGAGDELLNDVLGKIKI